MSHMQKSKYNRAGLDTKSLTKDMLEHESPTYDTDSKEAGWDSPERAQKLVEPFIVSGAKVLDIGIGTGQAVSGYADKGATIIGLDHDQAMLDTAQAVIGENGSLHQADINKELPIADLESSVDVAQAVGVLEFLPKICQVCVGKSIKPLKMTACLSLLLN